MEKLEESAKVSNDSSLDEQQEEGSVAQNGSVWDMWQTPEVLPLTNKYLMHSVSQMERERGNKENK